MSRLYRIIKIGSAKLQGPIRLAHSAWVREVNKVRQNVTPHFLLNLSKPKPPHLEDRQTLDRYDLNRLF